MLLGERPQVAMEFRRRNDVSPLALNRLDENGGHLVGSHQPMKQVLLDCRHALDAAVTVGEMLRTLAAVGVAGVRHAGNERPEAAPLGDFARGERERPHRAAVERAEKGDHLLPLRVIAGQFEGRLDRLGPRIGEEDFLGKRAGRDLRQFFGQLELAAIIEVGPRHVQKLRRLPMDGLDDARMAMARRADGDARVKIEEPVAVDVLDDGPFGPRHDQRVHARVRRRRHPFIAGNTLPRDGARQLRPYPGHSEFAIDVEHNAPPKEGLGPPMGMVGYNNCPTR